nr:MAG TPA: Integrase [Caudoviricetes sp.]
MPAYKNGTEWESQFYYVDWTGTRKKKHKRGFKRQKDALAYEREFLVQQQGSPDMLFSSLYELYKKDFTHRIRLSTIEIKESQFKTHILPYFGNKQINKITPANVREWQNKILAMNYKPTYIKTLHNQVSAIFNFAVKYYRLPINPARQAGSIGKKNAHSMKFWTLDQFKKFISTFTNNDICYVAFSILFYTGIRSGELLALTPADFSPNEKIISINKTFARIDGRDIIAPPKTEKSNRIVALPRFLVNMIQTYIDHTPYITPTDRLFPFTKSWLYKYIKRGAVTSGLEPIRVHDLRHSHASLLIEMGFSPLLIQERLGHEDIKTTLQTYSHLYPAKQEQLTARLDEIIK